MKSKAFTITELLVAVGLLAVVLAACGIIFNYSIDAQRTAGATAEIMRNLRVITDQLNADFAGFMGAPAYFRTEGDPCSRTADSVVFLATGDFQDANGTVRGNVARIYYGQSGFINKICPDPLSNAPDDVRNKILARKQVIIAPDANNSTDEYDAISVAEIQNKCLLTPGFYKVAWLDSRPIIDVAGNPNSIKMYLVRGVDNFTIEYFGTISAGKMVWRWPTGDFTSPALRFTFTLYDSKGIIKTGKRFEHIVYIGK
ncbi:MAG: type II secretion system protein [Phycisphaerae bacterium]